MMIQTFKYLKAVALLLIFSAMGWSQDTIVVQTLTHSDAFRSGVFTFPDNPGETYSKILMTYNMRCHNNQVGNGAVGCREWDYSCNTFITDSTITDSVRANHPSQLISNFSESIFEYTENPTYDYEVKYQQTVSAEPLANVEKVVVQSNDLAESNSTAEYAKYQFIMTKEVLKSAGLVQGSEIKGLFLKAIEPFLDGERVMVKAGQVNTIDFDNQSFQNLEKLYFDKAPTTTGDMDFIFHTPIIVDTNLNVVFEFLYPTENVVLAASDAPSGNAKIVQSFHDDRADRILVLDQSQYIDIPKEALADIQDEITIMTWVYGNPETLPLNTYLFEAVDENNNRTINMHLPWSDGSVYWDCGNEGGAYDRINKKADKIDFAGQWNHWAFTKNTTTGEMKIFLNGKLWQSGIGKTRPISIDKFRIGRGIKSANGYDGKINDFSVWSKALSESQIYQFMWSELIVGGPLKDSLLVQLHFNFDEASNDGVFNNVGRPAPEYKVTGPRNLERLDVEDIYISLSNARDLYYGLIHGDFTAKIDTFELLDSSVSFQHSVRNFSVVNNLLEEGSADYYWKAGYTYVYDENGVLLDSVWNEKDGEINVTDLTYYSFRPAKYEILSLVTPYGNGLTLGNEGKEFTFDVTDYGPILKGNRRMSIEMGGQNQEELDIKFHFIKGTPAREVKSIQNIWPFARGWYGPIQADEVFEKRMVNIPDGDAWKIRGSITGHGQNGEFQPRNHVYQVGGVNNEIRVWKECSTVPIYPQGGTWPIDRAGWCPGDPTLLHEIDITDQVEPGSLVEMDYNVLGPNMAEANYLVSSQLVTYGPKNFMHDASMVNIVRPSNRVEWQRENPACNTPTVIIKNTGADNLTSVRITYGVRGSAAQEVFDWTGDLAFDEEEMVVLPITSNVFWKDAVGVNEPEFEAALSMPNGFMDENTGNDKMLSKFKTPDIQKGPLQLEFTTNKRGSETSYSLKNQAGTVLYEGRNFGNVQNVVVDLDLSPGCYSLDFNDTGDDGLHFWFWELDPATSRGTGFVRFNRIFNGRAISIKGFEKDFGRFHHYDFGLDGIVSNKDAHILRLMNVSPNPSLGEFTLEYQSDKSEEIQIEVFDIQGKLIYRDVERLGADVLLKKLINLTGQPSGIYSLRLTEGDRSASRKIIIGR